MIVLLGIVYAYLIFITGKYVYATKRVKVKTENLGIKKEIPTIKEEILIVDNDVPVVKEEVQIIEDNDESWQINAHDSATTFGDLLMRHRRECESDGHPSKRVCECINETKYFDKIFEISSCQKKEWEE